MPTYEEVSKNYPIDFQPAKEDLWCLRCLKNRDCPYAWAAYNTLDDSCLMEK